MKRNRAISGQQSAVSVRKTALQVCQRAAFTLVELLASIAILGLMVVLLFAAFNQTSRAWLQGESRVETFVQARALLDMVSRELSQAMANSNLIFYGSCDSIAFIAPVSDNPDSYGVDLMEVVYRPDPDPGPNYFCNTNRPPFRIARRITPAYTNAVAVSQWDFYSNLINWPATALPTLTNALVEGVLFIRYDYFDLNGNRYQYWTSRPDLGSGVWPELGGGQGINVSPSDTFGMTNRCPAGLLITLRVVDSRALVRLQAVPVGSQAWAAITNEAVKEFTTFVSIPNRQP